MQYISDTLITFASHAYQNHDIAHSLSHALNVFVNARAIIEEEKIVLTPEEKKLLPIVMFCHDLLNPNMVAKGKCVPAEKVHKYYVSEVGEELAYEIQRIHDNCAWNKRDKFEVTKFETLRRILCDANWVEGMLLQRAISHSNENGEIVPDDVCRYIREKMLLIPEALHYDWSKRKAETHRVALMDYLQRNRM